MTGQPETDLGRGVRALGGSAALWTGRPGGSGTNGPRGLPGALLSRCCGRGRPPPRAQQAPPPGGPGLSRRLVLLPRPVHPSLHPSSGTRDKDVPDHTQSLGRWVPGGNTGQGRVSGDTCSCRRAAGLRGRMKAPRLLGHFPGQQLLLLTLSAASPTPGAALTPGADPSPHLELH